MPQISCKLISHSNSKHIQQIYTGFFMLYKRGLIGLIQKTLKEKRIDIKKPEHLQDARHAHLNVIINNNLRLHYDAHDSREIDEEYLINTDFYFKRSYSSSYLENLGKNHTKLYPLGLYYPVFPDTFDKFALKRIKISANKIEINNSIIHSFTFFDFFKFTPRVHLMESLPDYNLPPKILFMASAWDPYDNSDRLKEKIEDREIINNSRAKCIKLLKNEFGSNFYGGFIPTDFAIKNYKDLILPDKIQSSKRNYINRVKSYSICLATTGLHGSIGAKFAEYVAFSKAILSEKLNYEVPGDLKEDKNYLAFNTPEECLEKAKQLFVDRDLRNYLMTNNSRYYQSYLRPDSLILNTILTALSKNT